MAASPALSDDLDLFRRRLARGQRPAVGRAHARDLARLLGVRRRPRVRGRDARSRSALRARQRLGQDHVSQADDVSAEDMMALTRDGMKKFHKDATLYVRPMYWAERAGPQALPPDPELDALCAHALRRADAQAGRILHHAVAVPPADLGDRAGRRQGRLPLSEQCARAVRGEIARLRQCHRLRRRRQRRRARQFQRLHGQGRRRVHADPRTAPSSPASRASASSRCCATPASP